MAHARIRAPMVTEQPTTPEDPLQRPSARGPKGVGRLRPFSLRPGPGISEFHNTAIPTTSGQAQIASNKSRFPSAYIIADYANASGSYVYVGPQGAEVIQLAPGDIIPFTDVSPADFYVYGSTTGLKVYFIGFGDPGE
jgi:hypothetical protein